jgi:hypothetical protein
MKSKPCNRIEKFLNERAKIRGLDQIEVASLHSGDDTRSATLLVADLRTVLEERRRLAEECEENKDAFTLDGDERIYTFGGESLMDDFEFAEYGIDFGKRAIHGITPQQMVALACIMVDHLLINGHRFEIQKTHEQDQTLRLVPIA